MRYYLLPASIFLLCISWLSPAIGTAQVSYGSVTYTASPEFKIDGLEEELPQTDQIAKMLHDLKASGGFDKQFSLTFTPGAFVFEESREKDQTVEDGGMTVTIMRNLTEPDVFYTDTETATYTNQEAIADKLFLHSGAIPSVDWTLQDNQIPASDATLGFDLKTATAITPEGDSLIAAYAPALPLQFGPINYYGLPGAILQLDVCRDESCTRYRATNLRIMAVQPSLLPPTEGKEVSREKFYALQDKYRARENKTVTSISRQ
ncbi:MAG: GLPGLI family protein [Lewinella sp.]